MKKLMIAAAVAAMIGGAFATTYDVTASLKTTVGKYGQAKKVTTTYYLGHNATEMWYDEQDIAALIANDDTHFTTKKVSGVTVPCLTTAAKKDSAWLKTTFKIGEADQLPTTDKTGAGADGDYNLKSKGVWCESFTITEQPDGLCYRVAGTITAKGTIVDDCCLATAAPELLNVFGAASYASCTKAELYMGDAVTPDLFNTSVVDSTKADRTLVALSIAGQGSFGNVIDAYDGTRYTTTRGVTAISGYAVGTADAALCTHCCVVPVASQTWECNGNDWANGTAVYGSFSIKYNATKTKAEVNP